MLLKLSGELCVQYVTLLFSWGLFTLGKKNTMLFEKYQEMSRKTKCMLLHYGNRQVK